MDIAMFCNLVVLNGMTHLYYTYSYAVHTISDSYMFITGIQIALHPVVLLYAYTHAFGSDIGLR